MNNSNLERGIIQIVPIVLISAVVVMIFLGIKFLNTSTNTPAQVNSAPNVSSSPVGLSPTPKASPSPSPKVNPTISPVKTANPTSLTLIQNGSIKLDAKTTQVSADNFAVMSWSHTVAPGENRFLLVALASQADSGSPAVSTIYYGHQLMTVMGSKRESGQNVEIWGLVAPNVGTDWVTVSLQGESNTVGLASSWIGVNQSTPTSSFSSASGDNSQAAVVTSGDSKDLVVSVLSANGASSLSITPGSGQTDFWNDKKGAAIGRGSYNSGAKSSASWNISERTKWVMGAILLKPSN